MSRPLRIEFPHALYHVTSRGDRREDVFEDDLDRQAFLLTLEQVVAQFNWLCYAYCLMRDKRDASLLFVGKHEVKRFFVVCIIVNVSPQRPRVLRPQRTPRIFAAVTVRL